MNKRVVLLCVTSRNVINFRKKLINKLQNNGYDVSVVAFDSIYKDEVESLGVKLYTIEDDNRSVNPFKMLTLKNRFYKLLKQIDASIVFSFMLKPNIFGVRAAKKAGVKNIFAMVEGAGDVFINNSFFWKIIRFFICRQYKSSLKYAKKVFFLNDDDKNEFLARQLVQKEQCEIIHGIGVDLSHFKQKPLKNQKNFLMVARMLKTKGVLEYCECARLVKKKYPDAIFNYLGEEASIKLTDIEEYIVDGSINYLGIKSDIRDYLEESTCVVLPSYREGVPMSIMEAEAVGRAIITTNAIGCKETVIDGYNGFLVDVGNAQQLADKCVYFIENFDKAKEMSKNSRAFVKEKFDSEKINQQICQTIINESKESVVE